MTATAEWGTVPPKLVYEAMVRVLGRAGLDFESQLCDAVAQASARAHQPMAPVLGSSVIETQLRFPHRFLASAQTAPQLWAHGARLSSTVAEVQGMREVNLRSVVQISAGLC